MELSIEGGLSMKWTLLFFLCFNALPNILVVYSSRKEKFLRPLLTKFERETQIKVKLLSGVKVVKILEEQKRPLGNIFISNDVGQMEFLRSQGALKGMEMTPDFGISKKFMAPDYSWIGLSARSRILMYNKKLISEEKMPKTLWELTQKKWKGQFAITRGGNTSMIAHVAALSSLWGEEKTRTWIRKIKENAGAITNGHTEIRKAVGRGEFKFGLVNNYYYHLQRLEKKHHDVGAIYPDQQGAGVFTNSAGVALLKNPTHQAQAESFMKWVVKADNQKLFIHSSHETPLNPTIAHRTPGKNIHQYKSTDVPLKLLGPNWQKSKKLIESAGLDLAIK